VDADQGRSRTTIGVSPLFAAIADDVHGRTGKIQRREFPTQRLPTQRRCETG